MPGQTSSVKQEEPHFSVCMHLKGLRIVTRKPPLTFGMGLLLAVIMFVITLGIMMLARSS